MNWPSVAIGEIAYQLRNGKSVKQMPGAGGLPITRIETISSGSIDLSRCGYADLAEDECKGWLLRDGDILISHINSMKHLGKCAIFEGISDKVVHGMNLLCLRVNQDIAHPKFIFHSLRSSRFISQISTIAKKSVNQASFNISTFQELEIPSPPLEEQRRIAAILDKCNETELLATKATSLYLSLFKASFHSFLRQVEDRESIQQVPLSSVCIRITKGTTPSSLGLPDADGDIPFVRVQDIDKNVLIAESVALRIPVETHRALSRSMLQSGDILVSIAGTIGRVCEVRSLPPHGANCNQAVAIARPIPDVVRPLFLRCLLSDRPAQKQMRGAGVTGTITNLSLGQLGEIKIPVPSIEAQDRICDQLERLADIGERFHNSFVTAKRLSHSLTSFLMSGT
jgi:type I restriction enzyme, S subunit